MVLVTNKLNKVWKNIEEPEFVDEFRVLANEFDTLALSENLGDDVQKSVNKINKLTSSCRLIWWKRLLKNVKK